MSDRTLLPGRSSPRRSARRRTIGTLLTLGLGLGLGAAAAAGCKGKKTKDPAVCMNECEAECPYVPDSQGGNDEYIECVEACTTQCSG